MFMLITLGNVEKLFLLYTALYLFGLWYSINNSKEVYEELSLIVSPIVVTIVLMVFNVILFGLFWFIEDKIKSFILWVRFQLVLRTVKRILRRAGIKDEEWRQKK